MRGFTVWNKKLVADIQTKMLIYLSTATLDEKILFGEIIHL